MKKLLDSRTKSVAGLKDIFEGLEETLDVLEDRSSAAAMKRTSTLGESSLTMKASLSSGKSKRRRMSEILDLSKLAKIRRKDLSLGNLVPNFDVRVELKRVDQHSDKY